MGIPRVYADFQNLDDLNRLRLHCAGTLQDLERQASSYARGWFSPCTPMMKTNRAIRIEVFQ